jgi:hypothetical protein
MADILLDVQSAPATPSAGQMVMWADTNNKNYFQKDDAGLVTGDMVGAITSQIASHSADTYYKGLKLPSSGMQAGMVFEWRFVATKGAAGTATPVYTIRIGTAGTTADTSRLAITGPAQTAAADTGIFKVWVTCRSIGASGVLQGASWVQHNLAATGFANTPAGFSLVEGTSAGFDNQSLGNNFVGLSVNPGASGAWVVNQVWMNMGWGS